MWKIISTTKRYNIIISTTTNHECEKEINFRTIKDEHNELKQN